MEVPIKQRPGPTDLGAEDTRRLVPSATHEMPAYEHMSKSTTSAEWKSFVTSTDVGPWEDSVEGHLTSPG